VKITSILDIIDGKLLNSPSISFIYSFKTNVSKVKEGDLFIAYNLDDVQIAIDKGAFAIITQNVYPITDKEIAWIRTDNLDFSLIKLIRYKFAHFNLSAFYCKDISYEFIKTLSSLSSKNIKLLPKEIKNFVSCIDDINDETIIVSNDTKVLNKIYPNNSDFEKENFLISNLVEHSMFEVSFTYKDNYFQRIKIPSIYIEEFLRVYTFLDIKEFDDSRLKNFNFFKPMFLDKNLDIVEFGKSDKFIISQNKISLIKKETNYLKSKFTYGKIIYITSSYINLLPKDQIILEELSEIKHILKNQLFNALYIVGFKYEDIQQTLLKEEKELSLF
jgi:ferrochelatase